MSRQDKTTSERHTKTLRELVKRPENKVCADCKRSDPRWASWNLGVFMCIRCSGIHRSMGTHISKVKSVDLDIWTPEQMASIQKWGNRRANLYWEAHLKPGHQPPDHKIESFIRSKYESRRWAIDGPPPSDPAVLEQSVADDTAVSEAPQPSSSPPPAALTPPHRNATPSGRPAHALLSSVNATANRRPLSPPLQSRSQPQAPPPAPAPAKPADDLFSLDFHATPTISNNNTSLGASGAPKDVKNDIMSLFSSPAQSTGPASGATFGAFASGNQMTSQPAQTSLVGTSGTGMWGVSSGWSQPIQAQGSSDIWGGFATAPTQQVAQTDSFGGFSSAAQPNMLQSQNAWATTQTSVPNTNVWASSADSGSNDPFGSFGGTPATSTTQKKDDAFGDLWGGFK